MPFLKITRNTSHLGTPFTEGAEVEVDEGTAEALLAVGRAILLPAKEEPAPVVKAEAKPPKSEKKSEQDAK